MATKCLHKDGNIQNVVLVLVGTFFGSHKEKGTAYNFFFCDV